jgi:hypothetical protein
MNSPGVHHRLEALFGPLSPDEAAEVLADLEGRGVSLDQEEAAHRVLHRTAAAVLLAQGAPVPPMPDALLLRLEGIRHVASRPQAVPSKPRSTFRFPFWVGFALTSFAAVAVAALFFVRNAASPAGALVAAQILTPGSETGFTRPTFTWKLKTSAPVRAEVVDPETGAVIASLDQVFSPLSFDRLPASDLLPGRAYELKLSASGSSVTRPFRIAPTAAGAPAREPTLDGVIRQCETLLTQNRPSDAWMLWAELTEAEKSDPRMQALKARILGLIG